MTSAAQQTLGTVDAEDIEAGIATLGRVALATQGFLYILVGILAVQVARGDRGADPSQRGAIEAIAHQPYGRVLLVIALLGLATHVIWRIILAARGEIGSDEDTGSAAKRIANLGRAAIYVGFAGIAVGLLVRGGRESGGSGGGQQRRGTAMVLGWPGGRWLVIAAGLAVIGAGLWNGRKAVTRSFLDHLDLHRMGEGRRRAIEVVGSVGYAARAVVFALIGWFLVQAGLDHDANQTRGLDGALKEVAASDHGGLLLGVLAVGLVLFGAFRILDGLLRRPNHITYA